MMWCCRFRANANTHCPVYRAPSPCSCPCFCLSLVAPDHDRAQTRDECVHLRLALEDADIKELATVGVPLGAVGVVDYVLRFAHVVLDGDLHDCLQNI